MSKIDSAPLITTVPQHKLRPEQARTGDNHATEAARIDADNAEISYAELVGAADDMSLELEQFGRRRTSDKRARGSNPFDRILEDESEPKLDSLHLISRSPEINKQQFLSTARAMFPDASDFVLVLRELIRRKRIASADTLMFEELLAEVWEQSDKKMCQAGLNVGLKARIFSKKMRVSAKALRNTYRQFLLSEDEQVFYYQQWVEEYGLGRRRQIADFIEISLLHDIQSHDPSCSREEFGYLLGQLVKVKKLSAADCAFLNVFLRRNLKMLLFEDRLLECWFDCLQRPFEVKKEIETNYLRQLCADLMLPFDELRQKLLMGIRQIDAELFYEPEVRQLLIDALLDVEPPRQPSMDGAGVIT